MYKVVVTLKQWTNKGSYFSKLEINTKTECAICTALQIYCTKGFLVLSGAFKSNLEKEKNGSQIYRKKLVFFIALNIPSLICTYKSLSELIECFMLYTHYVNQANATITKTRHLLKPGLKQNTFLNLFRSYVAFSDKNRILGVAAKNQQVTNMKNTVYGLKRLLGRKFQDPHVQREIQSLPFNILEDKSGNIGIKVCNRHPDCN